MLKVRRKARSESRGSLLWFYGTIQLVQSWRGREGVHEILDKPLWKIRGVGLWTELNRYVTNKYKIPLIIWQKFLCIFSIFLQNNDNISNCNRSCKFMQGSYNCLGSCWYIDIILTCLFAFENPHGTAFRFKILHILTEIVTQQRGQQGFMQPLTDYRLTVVKTQSLNWVLDSIFP